MSGMTEGERDELRGERRDDALDERLRAHYAEERPDPRTIASLLAATAGASVGADVGRRRRRRPLAWAAVAATLLISSVVVHLGSSLAERTERTVREAAMNHNARLTLEFAAVNLDELNATMTRLPFELRRPDRIGAEWRPLGGRYCSLAGRLAAHVQLAGADGSGTLSLFVTREADDLERLAGLHRGVDGVDVELWAERGLFYAMARSAS